MAQVTKTPFSELTARYVFNPAGMAHSARIHRNLPLPATLAALLAKPYHVAPDGSLALSDSPAPQGDGAAGGVISSALDLARFDRALTEGKLLTPASLTQMWTAGRAPDGTVLPYGLGWFVQEFRGRNLTLILLANSDGLRWDQRLDEAAVERSPFVSAFLADFPR